MPEKIIIKCKGAAELPLDLILEFQGGLKKLPKKKLQHLKSLILKIGFIAPIFVWDDKGDYKILDGHQRAQALISLRQDGYDIPMIPVDYIEAENEDQARQMLLSITSQYGEFDKDELQEWIDQVDSDIAELLHFTEKDIDLSISGNSEETEGDDEISDDIQPITKLGDIWELGNHRVLCGDSGKSEDVEKVMNGDKASVCFTDPPYGVAIGDKNKMLNSFQKAGRNLRDIESDNKSPDELKTILVPIFKNARNIACAENCTYFVTAPQGGQLGLMMMMMMTEAGLTPRHVLMWYKNAPTFSMGRLDYDYQHEPILLTWTKKHKRPMLGTHKTSVWKIDKPRASKEHPTMKPVELYVNGYLNNSDSGDMSYEPFCGSGTAIISSEQTNRICRAIEIDPHYCDVIVKRYIDWMTKNNREINIKLNGKPFDYSDMLPHE